VKTVERPKKSNVRHGMASCGRYGCERDECKEAYYRSQKLSRIGQERGESARIPADEARAHGKMLTEAGMFVTDIARLAGVSRSIVGQVISGRVSRVHRDTAAAILGVPAPRKGFVGCDGIVSALAAQRRIRALSRRGFSLKAMARETGASVFTVDSIRNGNRTRIRASMDQAIHAAYNRLWNADPLDFGVTPGGVTQARNWAAEQEWAPPAAWDDDTIGDPRAKPKGMLPRGGEEIGA
jgi:transcriptional regulator with XRE-family HTH domain